MIPARSIYVVDDSADYRVLFQNVFADYLPKYPVRLFDSGRDLLNDLPINPLPSLILLDRHMPILDGHKILIHLKEDKVFKKIPIVMMSTAPTAEEVIDCYSSGANSFITKTEDVTSLKSILEITCHYWLEVNQLPSRR